MGGNEAFEVSVSGGSIVGQRLGEGPSALLLHGGPGLSGDYTESLAVELADVLQTFRYQQRGQAPTTVCEPFDVEAHVDDAITEVGAVKVRGARTGKGDSEVIEEALRRELGFDLLERLWQTNDPGEEQALALAVEAQHKTSARRR